MAKQVLAAHILVDSESKAKELLEKVQKGDNFGELARRFSSCPSKRDGGSLGWFGRGQMVKPFEDAAFNGKKGETVGPVKTEFGWHLIRIVDQR